MENSTALAFGQGTIVDPELEWQAQLCGTIEEKKEMAEDPRPENATCANVPPFPPKHLLYRYLSSDADNVDCEEAYRAMLDYKIRYIRDETGMPWEWNDTLRGAELLEQTQAPAAAAADNDDERSESQYHATECKGWPTDVVYDIVAHVIGSPLRDRKFIPEDLLVDIHVPFFYRQYNYDPWLHQISARVWEKQEREYIRTVYYPDMIYNSDDDSEPETQPSLVNGATLSAHEFGAGTHIAADPTPEEVTASSHEPHMALTTIATAEEEVEEGELDNPNELEWDPDVESAHAGHDAIDDVHPAATETDTWPWTNDIDDIDGDQMQSDLDLDQDAAPYVGISSLPTPSPTPEPDLDQDLEPVATADSAVVTWLHALPVMVPAESTSTSSSTSSHSLADSEPNPSDLDEHDYDELPTAGLLNPLPSLRSESGADHNRDISSSDTSVVETETAVQLHPVLPADPGTDIDSDLDAATDGSNTHLEEEIDQDLLEYEEKRKLIPEGHNFAVVIDVPAWHRNNEPQSASACNWPDIDHELEKAIREEMVTPQPHPHSTIATSNSRAPHKHGRRSSVQKDATYRRSARVRPVPVANQTEEERSVSSRTRSRGAGAAVSSAQEDEPAAAEN